MTSARALSSQHSIAKQLTEGQCRLLGQFPPFEAVSATRLGHQLEREDGYDAALPQDSSTHHQSRDVSAPILTMCASINAWKLPPRPRIHPPPPFFARPLLSISTTRTQSHAATLHEALDGGHGGPVHTLLSRALHLCLLDSWESWCCGVGVPTRWMVPAQAASLVLSTHVPISVLRLVHAHVRAS